MVTPDHSPNSLSKQTDSLDPVLEKRASAYTVRGDSAAAAVESASLERRRTADPHGLSGTEKKILVEAAHYLKTHGSAVFITVGCRNDDERRQREIINQVKKRVVIYQDRAGTPGLWIEVLEANPKLHSHIIAAMPSMPAADDFAQRLLKSSCGRHLKCKRVYKWDGLIKYLLKEATPQAWYGARMEFRRLPKDQRVGSVAGDRVRLSKALEAVLMHQGKLEPRTRTYAVRLPRQTSSPTAVSSTAMAAASAAPVQLALPLALAPVIDLFAIVEEKRKALGITQRELAHRLGFRQPQYSNAIVRRHDPLSPWARNRVREYVAEAA